MSNNNIKNKEVYKMYKGKMCLKHTVEFYTPIADELKGYVMFQGQLENSDEHKQSMNDMNEKIQEVLGDNFQVDIARVETTVMFGEPMNINIDD